MKKKRKPSMVIGLGEWRPKRDDPIPLYRQIASYIREKISVGEWPVGYKIPPERTLAVTFKVNRSTVVAAVQELTAEGLIQGRSGSGTIVVQQPDPFPTLHWPSYVNAGMFHPNLPTIQEINRLEFVPNMIRLGTGEPSSDLYPHANMKQVLAQVAEKIPSLGYEEPKGLYKLRREVSRHLAKKGINVPPSCILIVSGALQGLQLISLGLMNPGATMLMEKPSYLYSLNLLPSTGIRMKGIELDAQGISQRALLAGIQQQTAQMLYTIPTFQNPTGKVLSESGREQLLKLCQQERIALIEDDVYSDLWLDEEPPLPIKALDQKGTVLYVGSMSKTISPGLRIGWLVAPETVIDRLADLKMQTVYGASSLSQWTVYEWLASGLYEQHLLYVREQLRARRDFMLALLERYFNDLATWSIPAGGFYIWLCFLHEKISMRSLFKRAQQQSILLNPGNLYDPLDDTHLRLSYSYASYEQLEFGMKQLAQIVRNLVECPRGCCDNYKKQL
ncbi:MAG TPA: GntR family transcriptional regulator [Brevibacillus sp.]|nr:GntR family transcriptional regulator [Brevibacillus sp.]